MTPNGVIALRQEAGAGCANEEVMNMDCWDERQELQRRVAGPVCAQ